MTIIYPAVFTLEDGVYNVEFPDLKGCLTYGETLEEAFSNAKEALSGYAASILERGKNLPSPTALAELPTANGIPMLIDAKPAFTKAAVKKTLTIPAWLNQRAEEAHAPYSKILQDALEHYLGLA